MIKRPTCTDSDTHCQWCHRDVESVSEHLPYCMALFTESNLREFLYKCPKHVE